LNKARVKDRGFFERYLGEKPKERQREGAAALRASLPAAPAGAKITDFMKRQSNRQFYVRKGTGACFHIAPPHVGEFHADQLGTSRFLTGRQSRPGGGLFPPSAAPRPRGGRVPFSI